MMFRMESTVYTNYYSVKEFSTDSVGNAVGKSVGKSVEVQGKDR